MSFSTYLVTCERFWKRLRRAPVSGACLYYMSLPLRAWVTRRRQRFAGTGFTGDVPVICIGNISLGGTGKSPLVEYVAGLCAHSGHRVGILSRGYGGKFSKGKPHLAGTADTARQLGDEPYMFFSSKHLRGADFLVAVSPNRKKGIVALSQLGASCILMDDGLQHFAVSPSCTICVVAIEDLDEYFCDSVIPAAPFRERPSVTLRKFDAVVFTKKGLISQEDRNNINRLKEFCVLPKSFEVSLLGTLCRPAPAQNTVTGQEEGPDTLELAQDFKEANLLTAVAKPDSVRSTIQSLGILVKNEHTLPDHYQFTAVELKKYLAGTAGPIVCTRKDWVKIEPLMEERERFWIIEQSVHEHPDGSLSSWISEKISL